MVLNFRIVTIAVGLLKLWASKATVLFERLLPLDAMIIAYYFGAKSKD